MGAEIGGAEIPGTDVVLGSIQPRLSAVERGDLATRLAAARGELEGSRASLTVAKAALERTRSLNAVNKSASDRALEEAQARVKSEEARSAAATDAIETLQALLEPGAESKASVPISLSKAGTVVEVLAHPGESVDAGASLLRLENFNRLLARIDMPLDGVDHDAAETIRVASVGNEESFIEAHRVGPAANVDVASQGGAVLYAFEQPASRKDRPATALVLRPGQAVVAWIPLAPTKQRGFLLPRSAVLRYAGKTWVYDATGEEEFMRREIELGAPTEKGWFVTAEWAGKSRVVVTGAAELLSEEILGTQQKPAEEP
jgi:biotin carboxyl carrier protein